MSQLSPKDEMFIQVYCPITNKELLHRYFENDIAVSSHGKCTQCNTLVHVDALHFSGGVTQMSWPVIYEGMWCNRCWDDKPKELPSEFEPAGNQPF